MSLALQLCCNVLLSIYYLFVSRWQLLNQRLIGYVFLTKNFRSSLENYVGSNGVVYISIVIIVVVECSIKTILEVTFVNVISL